jgi:hypothetical protein
MVMANGKKPRNAFRNFVRIRIMNLGRGRKLILFIGVVCGVVGSSFGQFPGGTLGTEYLRPSSASFYFIAKQGELAMQVNIWGFVKNPGRYEVSTATDLIKLLSYAGGPTEDAVLYNVKVVRNPAKTTGPKIEEFTVDLEDLASLDSSHLVLYPDDTIYIDHSSWLNLRNLFLVITTAGVVTAAVAQIIIASSK